MKELSKRTTFIRVSAQLNEVFGSTDEGKKVPAPSTVVNVAAAEDNALKKTRVL